ncbi:uncharacterized protein LOC119391314 [Rhipicephalus sanguineus]|uniref:uncharacterized protein LOC119391314 n=1 Tax=Rhipicephalus sanguineus TaxID=34632 RepID=UPI0020C318B5|nr:uncharacterized protein LOC119391314 [Rhipicephalus sanguineus]
MLFLTLKRRGRSHPWTKGWAIAAAMFALLSLLTQVSKAESAANASSNATSEATLLRTMRTTTSEQDDASDFLKELKEMMARSFADMPTSLRRKMLEAEVRPECSIALMRTIRAFLNFEPWALKLFDASGKYPTGLFQGSHADLGAFDECLETVLHDSYGNVMARGQYCKLLVYSKNGTATESAILSVQDVLHPRVATDIGGIPHRLCCGRTAVPMFFFIACLYILPRFVSGPDTKAFFLELYSGMGRYWWYLLLMIRNYAGTNALDVLPHIWYLSTDFQLFAISLLTLLLFKSVMDVTMNEYYVRPYYHAICYFSGCITCLLIDDFRNRKISKASQIAGWCISFSCGLCCVFMKLSWYRSQTPPTEAAKLLAAFFDRILWSVFLIWVTLACSTGRGGFVNKLLSWNVFVAPSKLSFGVYLIHMPFIRLSLQASRERLFWSTFNVASMYFSVLAWSYVLAYFTYLVCEAPTTVLDKLAFARITQSRQSVHKQNSKPQLNGIDVKQREKAADGVFSRL